MGREAARLRRRTSVASPSTNCVASRRHFLTALRADTAHSRRRTVPASKRHRGVRPPRSVVRLHSFLVESTPAPSSTAWRVPRPDCRPPVQSGRRQPDSALPVQTGGGSRRRPDSGSERYRPSLSFTSEPKRRYGLRPADARRRPARDDGPVVRPLDHPVGRAVEELREAAGVVVGEAGELFGVEAPFRVRCCLELADRVGGHPFGERAEVASVGPEEWAMNTPTSTCSPVVAPPSGVVTSASCRGGGSAGPMTSARSPSRRMKPAPLPDWPPDLTVRGLPYRA